jgi:hypothetical protein
MPTVFLGTGQSVQLDVETWCRVHQEGWWLSFNPKNGYVYLKKAMSLHRYVFAPEGKFVDHIDMNKLNCRRENLRTADMSLNVAHRPKRKNSKNKYKGVSKNTDCGTYSARCGKIYLGSFSTQEEAARAYNVKARELYGDYAILNEVVSANI